MGSYKRGWGCQHITRCYTYARMPLNDCEDVVSSKLPLHEYNLVSKQKNITESATLGFLEGLLCLISTKSSVLITSWMFGFQFLDRHYEEGSQDFSSVLLCCLPSCVVCLLSTWHPMWWRDLPDFPLSRTRSDQIGTLEWWIFPETL